MKVKELDKTVNLAWSPPSLYPVLVAAGTAAQQLDASFSTSASLDIYDLNLNEPGLDMELRSSVQSQNRFHKLAWGACGAGVGNSGVVVGGCDNGRLLMYNAAQLITGDDGLMCAPERHTGPVRAIDFNSFQTNLLSTGASDSEIFIWDLNNVKTPMTPGAKSQPAEEVLWLAWNQQVQHILASAFATRCVVWDLRKNEPIIKLSDSNSRVKWKVVAWHPDVATQLCLASEEDSNPVIQLWDLRFATTPIKTLEGHQKGVLSIAWCSQDPELLVSCGKDSRILCWNPAASQQGDEIVCEMETSNQWNFEVSWCPRNPSLVATSSFDGHASVFSLVGGQQQMQTTNKIADSFPGMEQYVDAPVVQPPQHHAHVSAELRKAPKWLKRPVGASFAFGGKLVSFGVESQAVAVSQVVVEPALLERSRHLQQLLSADQLGRVCHGRSDPVWSFVAASLEPDARTAMRTLLGFTQDQLELNKYIGQPQPLKSNHGDIDSLTEDFSVLSSQDVSDEEGKLKSLSGMGSFSIVQNNVNHFNSSGSDDHSYLSKKSSFKIKIGEEKDGLICRALLAGNLPLAVDLCMKEGRMTDAIILANTAGPDVLAATQFKYFQQNQGSLSQLVSAVVMGDWSPVASNCDLENWAEALAAMLTYATDDQLPSLCERLGDRLEREGGVDGRRNSEICFVAAGQLGHLIQNRIAADLSTEGLQELVELVLVAGRGDVHSSDTAHLLDRYAQLLAAQGDLDTAITYLAGNQEDIQELRERLYIASGQKPYPTPHAQQKNNYYQNAGQTGYGAGYGKVKPTTPHYHQSTPPSSSMFPPPGMPSAAPQRKPSISNSLVNNFQNSASPVTNFPPANIFSPSNFPSASSSLPSQPPLMNPIPPTNILNPTSAFVPSTPAPKPFPSSALPPQPPPTSRTPVHFNQETAPPPANPGAPQNNFSMRSSPSPSVSGGSRKYVVDPSVGGGGGAYHGSVQHSNPYMPQPTGPYGLPPQSAASLYGPSAQPQPAVPLYGQPVQPTPPQPSLYNQPPAPRGGTQFAQSAFNHPSQQPFNPPPPINTQPEPRPQQFVPQTSGAPGWNDPPTLTSASRNQAKEVYQPPAITHPLFSAAPQHEMPVQMQPMQGMPLVQQGYSVDEPVYRGGYIPPGPALPAAQVQVAEPPRPKPPLPEEHMHLQTVLEELRNRCTCAANAPQLRRKLEDVARKLELLYDAIRDNKVSAQTLSSLHQLVQTAQTGDYPAALHLHTQIASGPDFSQISAFMPGLKVLVQSALQLGVYLQ